MWCQAFMEDSHLIFLLPFLISKTIICISEYHEMWFLINTRKLVHPFSTFKGTPWTGCQLVAGHIDKETNKHSQFRLANSPNSQLCMPLDCGRKHECLERTHTGMERTCKLYTETPEWIIISIVKLYSFQGIDDFGTVLPVQRSASQLVFTYKESNQVSNQLKN